MVPSQSQKQSQRFRLSIVAAILAMGAVTLVAFSPSLVSLAQQSSVRVSQPLVTSSLVRLTTSSQTTERLAAVSWLGKHVTTPSTNELNTLATVLQTDSDPTVRASVATALKQIAINQKQNPEAVGRARNVEPQLLEILESAYSNEKNAAVRRCIVEAAAQLTYPQAAYFLSRAKQDSDPTVSEAAKQAEHSRDLSAPVGFSPPLK
ncbi:MAG TPA: HEAT repeat domain-containing protein [Candidatus Melainabacteria bacterium]|nr:HEAT repeat domain-containing protein [Candidatus Melainabacteria bacterium]